MTIEMLTDIARRVEGRLRSQGVEDPIVAVSIFSDMSWSITFSTDDGEKIEFDVNQGIDSLIQAYEKLRG